MKALITGISGFAGSHMAEYLLQNNVEVAGTIRQGSQMHHLMHLSGLQLVDCDLRDSAAVAAVVESTWPDIIFHLAAQSYVPVSWKSPLETLYNNIAGQLNLFEAIRHLQLPCKLLLACSSEEYGQVAPHEVPIKETHTLRPLSPYAVSKVAQEHLGYQYYKNYGMHVVVARTFNHTGPRGGEHFVLSNFAKQIADIEKGKQPPVLWVGNLQAKRDFTDVRDVVRAYWLALDKAVPGEAYNIASGTCHSIEEMLRILLSFSAVSIEVKPDPSRLRPSDVPMVIGDYTKFHQAAGWKPEIPLQQTLKDLLEYWRTQP
ncbi:GDP-mannose 4,6-dehydratase [Paenibacillus cremeus]|uniref:GDP-mannose 4,6-dehydratase n=1 Tax=Paenibacillus cremeus TaxID=2163881 RepID=A0A559KI75_9BACL|nr:GDP-mannose 4,6-dehydratase [Paenibacillus cremeus]TVY11837.1 GDP-mannose 4,6-dehydratase [Paenibacillus cremeus]